MKPRTIETNIGKAHGTQGFPVDSLILRICEPVRSHETLEDCAALYDVEGGELCRLLRAHLPGGTFDALLRHMLFVKASFLRVPMFAECDK
jgi:hypothetical protein